MKGLNSNTWAQVEKFLPKLSYIVGSASVDRQISSGNICGKIPLGRGLQGQSQVTMKKARAKEINQTRRWRDEATASHH
jgi:hypothetical protein